MLELSNQVIEHVFREERYRLIAFLTDQKRNLRYWLLTLLVVVTYVAISRIESIAPYLVFHFQGVLNVVLFTWLLAIITLPFWWPQKPGDFFKEDFRKGLDPRIWEYLGDWKVELDERGASILTVTDSNYGGLALPCLSWVDYEVTFDVRILNGSAGWIIRASSLNDYVLQKLNAAEISTLYRVTGYLPKVGSMKHGLTIDPSNWFRVRILARGAWLSTYIKVDGKEHLVFQDQALGVKPPAEVETRVEESDQKVILARQQVTPSYRLGSFGFRVHGEEMAQFRQVRAYRLKR